MNTLRERKARIVRLTVDGTFDEEQARVESKPLNDRLTEIEALLAATTERTPLDDLPLGTEEVRAAWKRLPMGTKRAVLRVVMDVTLLRVGRGRKGGGAYFDGSSVEITWKR